jgi:hypothetical protein
VVQTTGSAVIRRTRASDVPTVAQRAIGLAKTSMAARSPSVDQNHPGVGGPSQLPPGTKMSQHGEPRCIVTLSRCLPAAQGARAAVLVTSDAELSLTSHAHNWSYRLLHRIGWSVQVPGCGAAERDEAAVTRWKEETWPAIEEWPSGGRLAGL